MSHGAPYRHFPDRQDFLAALSQVCRAEFVAVQEEATAAAPDPGPPWCAEGWPTSATPPTTRTRSR